MGNFVDLRIDRTGIEPLLMSKGYTVEATNKNTTSQKNIKVKNANNESFTLEIYYKSNGSTTLVARNDTDNISDDVCKLLNDELKFFDISNINAIISVKQEDFDEILNNIKITFPNDFQKPKLISGGTQYSLTALKEGGITFKYFNKNNKLQLQGKALKHFNFIFMQLTDKGYELLQTITEMKEITFQETPTLLQEYMPIMNGKLPIDAKKIAATSLQLLKINANFSDGFIIAYPMIRTLEHVMRVILEKYGYPYLRGLGFNMFGTNADSTWALVPKEGCTMDENCRLMLGRCYTFYNIHRIPFSHMSDDIAEIRIISAENAKELTLECIELIEEIGNDFY